MKIGSVKVGTKVKLKKDYESLKRGMKGTIIENGNYVPYISWDNYVDGHDGHYCRQTRIDLGLPENSVDYADIEDLKRIKE